MYGVFPGGPVFRTPCFHCRGSDPWSGKLRSHKLCCTAKKEKKFSVYMGVHFTSSSVIHLKIVIKKLSEPGNCEICNDNAKELSKDFFPKRYLNKKYK